METPQQKHTSVIMNYCTPYSYSDNEKQLFEQMKRMQAEHEKVVKGYEDRITELLANLAELRHLAGKIDNRNGLSAGGQHTDKDAVNGDY